MKKLKLNNKGFSLVELICAVALLGAVVIPLLLAFVTSSNLSNKAIQYTESTLAAENVLKAIEARPVSDFTTLNDTTDATKEKKEIISEMLSRSATAVTFANVTDNRVLGTDSDNLINDDGEFVAVMQGIKSGNSTYDAVVTFDRGSTTVDTNTKYPSYGLHEINSQSIAEYDKMNAVFSQPYLNEANPDIRADTELKAIAASRFGKDIDAEPDGKQRNIIIDAYTEDTGDTISCYIEYTYTYTYNNVKEGNGPLTTKSIDTSYTYAIFPGGYEYTGQLISIYVMYYPWYYSTDDIMIKNNSTNGAETPINLSVYLYMQNPYVYIEKGTVLVDGSKAAESGYAELELIDTDPDSYTDLQGFQIVKEISGESKVINFYDYEQELTYQLPETYEIDSTDPDNPSAFTAETLVYTNARKYTKNEGSFKYNVQQGEGGYISGGTSGQRFKDTIDGQLVKTKINKLMYNITVEIYDHGSVQVNDSDHTITVSEDPVYKAVSSKAQK